MSAPTPTAYQTHLLARLRAGAVLGQGATMNAPGFYWLIGGDGLEPSGVPIGAVDGLLLAGVLRRKGGRAVLADLPTAAGGGEDATGD